MGNTHGMVSNDTDWCCVSSLCFPFEHMSVLFERARSYLYLFILAKNYMTR